MKKLLLSFMSLFLVLGTAMAQDDKKEEENAEFKLMSIFPQEGAYATNVGYIQLTFSKEVSVTLPEGGIAVTNTTTNEEVKITRLNEYAPKIYAVFMFEQIAQTDEKGDETLIEQTISTPGAYTFTIPAGVIKSVDGEEFPEQTFTFNIVSTLFPVANYSPKETVKLDKIELTFNGEITKVNMPKDGLRIIDTYYSPVAYTKKDVVISEDKKTVTLELDTAITEPGMYALELETGIFLSADSANEKNYYPFNVIDPTPKFVTNYQDGDQVKELSNVLEITFKNVEKVELKKETMTLLGPGESSYNGTAVLDSTNNKITVTFDATKFTDGEYTFHIPAGMFTMNGVENQERAITVTLLPATEITQLAIKSITPTAGEVDQIERIVVSFNQPIRLSMDENWQQISREIKLTCDDGKEYILTNDPGFGTNAADELVYLANAEWVDNAYKSTPITVAGVYTLNLADIVVDHAPEEGIDEWGYPATIWHAKNQSCAGTCVWTVTGGSAVEKIEVAAGEQAIYDLLGRRIEKITGTGIYIVNGKKVVIK